MSNPKDEQELTDRLVQHNRENKPVVLNPSYQRKEPFVLTDEDRKAITDAVASIDMDNIHFQKTLTPAERFQIAGVMIAVSEQNAARELCQSEPDLSERDALRIVRSGITYKWRKLQPINFR